MSRHKGRSGGKRHSLYRWHRYAGLGAALLVAWLSITGLFLNHADDLALDKAYVQQHWLLGLYGVHPLKNLHGQPLGEHWLVQADAHVYLDDTVIAEGKTVGGARLENRLVVAFADRLHLYTARGELLEALPFSVTKAPLTAIAAHVDGFVLATATDVFLADRDLLSFTRLENRINVPAMTLKPLPAALHASIARDVFEHSLHWERVLVDLHAGRLFGAAGKWLADIAGILLLFLAASGVIVWIQRTRSRRS